MIGVAAVLIADLVGLGIGWAARGALEHPKPIGLDDWGQPDQADQAAAPVTTSIHAKADEQRRRHGRLDVPDL